MPDDNKNIPPSAGEAAKAIAADDLEANEQKVQPVEPKDYEKAKPVAADPYSKTEGIGWKISAIIFAVMAIASCCALVVMVMSKDEAPSNETAKCTDEKSVQEPETPSESDGYTFSFYRSGLKLKLGESMLSLNLDYSSEPPADDTWVERLAIGGLSANTTGAQNIPDYARGRYEFSAGSAEELRSQWAPLAFVDIYEKQYYDETIAQQIEQDDTASWGNVVYSDDQYVVLYSHAQNAFSPEGWEQDWEMASSQAIEAIVKDSANWSK
jgi:hypothetical protein